MKKTAIFLLLMGVLGQRMSAQEIQLNEAPQISGLMTAWVNHNRTNPHMEGWRVQVMASTDRTQIDDGRARFRRLYPDVPAEWVHESPYYKLRVGVFRTRQEALAFIANLNEFPGAYPAKDVNIHPRDFLER